MKKKVAAALALLAVAGLVWSVRFEVYRRIAGLPPFTSPGFVETVEMVPLRDGVKLHTRIYRPADVDRAPVIFVRNPYALLAFIEKLQCGALAQLGYACVLQDVRGQMGSEGEWYPITHEREDGLDALGWLVKQPWQNGNIAMRGASYLTCVQWAVSDSLPPEVKTLVPSMFGTDLRQVFYERGLFRHDILTAWATLMPGRGMHHLAGLDYLEAARHRPALEADERFMGARIPWYRELLRAADPYDEFWNTPQMQTFRAAPEKTQVPMLFVAGFFEPFFMTHFDSWQRAASKSKSVLLLGPWNHLTFVSGDVESKAPQRLSHWPIMLEWFDHHLKGKPLRELKPGTVKLWGVGDDGWRELPDWPQETAVTLLGLGGAAAANTCEGGQLGEGGDGEVSFVFDPARPVRTRGGAALLSVAFFRYLDVTPGPVEQNDAESCARDDVLTFRSAPSTRAQRLSGAAKLKLRVKSSAPDTAFVARLVAEQHGQQVLVREAAATLAWPDARTTQPRVTTPGDEVTLELDFWPVDWLLPEGARWRLDITSSSFPALHVHSNRAGRWEEQTGFDVATQTVLLNGSTLELPLDAPLR